MSIRVIAICIVVACVATVAVTVAGLWPRVTRAESAHRAATARADASEGRVVSLSSELAVAREQLAKQPAERVVERVVYQPIRAGCLPAFERSSRLYVGGQP